MDCPHDPACPPSDAVDHAAAKVIATFPAQGWSLLCNGIVAFHDTGELRPDGHVVEPQRGPAVHAAAQTPALVS